MQKKIVAAGFFLFSFLLPLRATAATFSGMYVFGDSLSDSGNVFKATFNPSVGIGFPPTPYVDGRFSNGPNWVDYLAEDLELSPLPSAELALGVAPTQGINFAFGGATTGLDNTVNPSLPGLRQQIGLFTSLIQNQSADPNALYIVWVGANDYLLTTSKTFAPFDTPETTIGNLSFALNSLTQVGAKNIMLVNLPDLGQVPVTYNSPLSDSLNKLSKAHNHQLKTLSQGLGSDINLIEVDVNALFTQAIKDKKKFGFKNVTDACLTNFEPPIDFDFNICDRPNEYLFWDQIHPTTAAHKLIGELAYKELKSQSSASVPEPTSVLGLIAFSILGAGSMLKRQR